MGPSTSTSSTISILVPLDKYGARPHTRAGISIHIIHGYLIPKDIRGYPWIFELFFCTKKNTFLITYKLQLLKIHT